MLLPAPPSYISTSSTSSTTTNTATTADIIHSIDDDASLNTTQTTSTSSNLIKICPTTKQLVLVETDRPLQDTYGSIGLARFLARPEVQAQIMNESETLLPALIHVVDNVEKRGRRGYARRAFRFLMRNQPFTMDDLKSLEPNNNSNSSNTQSRDVSSLSSPTMIVLDSHSSSSSSTYHSGRGRKRSATALPRHRKTRKKLSTKSESGTLDTPVSNTTTTTVTTTNMSVLSSTINVDDLPRTILRPPICCCCRRPWPTRRIDVVIDDATTTTTNIESVPLVVTSEPTSLLNTTTTHLPVNTWSIAESGPSHVADTIYQHTPILHSNSISSNHVKETETAEQIRAIEALMFDMDSDDNSSLDITTTTTTALPTTTTTTTTTATMFNPIINEQSVLETTARLLASHQQQWSTLDLSSDTFSTPDISSVLDTNTTLSTITESLLLNNQQPQQPQQPSYL